MNLKLIRNVLNVLFMLLAIASVVVYFTTDEDNRVLFVYVCGCAIVVKIIEYSLRFIKMPRRRDE